MKFSKREDDSPVLTSKKNQISLKIGNIEEKYHILEIIGKVPKKKKNFYFFRVIKHLFIKLRKI